ncbi:MAG: hypothetical protein NTU44_06955 [Bacteroidetes bacterium]|nr:hypothetical protein [Bacteroidota bacterium]
MSNKILFLIFYLLTIGTTNAQTSIFKPNLLKYEMDSLTKTKILTSLDSLFSQIKRGKIDDNLINKDNSELSISTFKSFSGIEENKQDSIPDFYKKQLLNIYQISTNQFWITLAFIGNKNIETPILKNIINLVVTNTANNITFSIPAKYLTNTWNRKTVGNVTYIFRSKINLDRATLFNAKNTRIATKLGLQPEKLNFYLCNNYQEILQLLGYEYDLDANGQTRDGYGVDANTIFSIMNNEDFSHDIFHYYSAKIRGDIKRNRTVEEGIAYSWGNAYYTKANGEMVEQKELLQELRNYLKANTKTSLLEIFNNDTKIFSNLPAEISVKSTIASLLCDEVERKKGLEGIITLIKCGRGDDNFFKTLNDLTSINQNNFDIQVMKLIEQKK